MFQQSPGCRLFVRLSPSGAGKRTWASAARPKVRALPGGERKVCGWCCPRMRAATDAGLPCDEAVTLPQRGAPAAFDRDVPMSDRSKTEVLCRVRTIWFRQHDAVADQNPILVSPHHPQRMLTIPTPSRAPMRGGCCRLQTRPDRASIRTSPARRGEASTHYPALLICMA